MILLVVANQDKFCLRIATGKHLAELCKAEYPKYVKYCLWLLAEVAVIAADIPEGKTIKLTNKDK